MIRGLDIFIKHLDKAVISANTQDITNSVRAVLGDFIGNQKIEFSEDICTPDPETYARKLIHIDEDKKYSVFAMIWGPGQGTPLHDHAGLWVVEGVLQGTIHIDQYDLLEKKGDQFRFKHLGCADAQIGETGHLIPPFEYHTITNRSEKETSVTIHVYGGDMTECTVFEPAGEGWYQAVPNQMQTLDLLS